MKQAHRLLIPPLFGLACGNAPADPTAIGGETGSTDGPAATDVGEGSATSGADESSGADQSSDGSDCASVECPDGHRCESDDGEETCVDIDECQMPDACPPGEVCTNLDPGFRCESSLPPVSGCGLDEAAFCEDFEVLHPGGRGGDLDERRWGVARWTHESSNMFYRRLATSTNDSGDYVNPDNGETTLCGEPIADVGIGQDMRICDGPDVEGGTSRQFHEVGNDTGDFLLNSMMVRQPFDFTDRTGTLVFDVDAKHNRDDGGHGWWIEIFIAEDPVPMVYQEAPSIDSQPRNGIGLEFTSNGTVCNELGQNVLSHVVVIRDWQIHRSFHSGDEFERNCFEATDTLLNRFEIRVSRNHAEVYVSDASTPTDLRLVATVNDIDLNFERGFVTLHHVGYNAIKDYALPSQTYRWDNVGFDGPRLAPLRAYDIPNNAGQDYGYELSGGESQVFTINDVEVGDAEEAWFNLNYLNGNFDTEATMEFRVNAGPWLRIEDYIVGHNPDRGTATARAFSAPVAIGDVVDGTNTIEVRGGADPLEVANMDLSLR